MTIFFDILLFISSTILSTLGTVDPLVFTLICSALFIILTIILPAMPSVRCPKCAQLGIEQ